MKNSTTGPSTLHEAAVDFEVFLSRFFSSIFPQFSKNDLHIADESFGGRYLPVFTKYIDERQKMEARNALTVSIRSVILVDAVLDMIGSGTGGLYDHFCSRDERGMLRSGGFNEIYGRTLFQSSIEFDIHQWRLNGTGQDFRYCHDTFDINPVPRMAEQICWR